VVAQRLQHHVLLDQGNFMHEEAITRATMTLVMEAHAIKWRAVLASQERAPGRTDRDAATARLASRHAVLETPVVSPPQYPQPTYTRRCQPQLAWSVADGVIGSPSSSALDWQGAGRGRPPWWYRAQSCVTSRPRWPSRHDAVSPRVGTMS